VGTTSRDGAHRDGYDDREAVASALVDLLLAALADDECEGEAR